MTFNNGGSRLRRRSGSSRRFQLPSSRRFQLPWRDARLSLSRACGGAVRALAVMAGARALPAGSGDSCCPPRRPRSARFLLHGCRYHAAPAT